GGLVNGIDGNLVGVADPKLGPLGSNGGPTYTHALLPGSPAIDAGDNALGVDNMGQFLTTDQRGAARVVNGTVDIGAFETPTEPVQLLENSGTNSNDSIYIHNDSAKTSVQVWINHDPAVDAPDLSKPSYLISGIHLSPGDGIDDVTIDFSNGNPLVG